MKRLIWALTLVALFVTLGLSIVQAQGNRITVGPEFLAGGSVYAGTVPKSLKTDARFSFNFGALGYYNSTESFALMLGLVYDSRGMNFHQQDDANHFENSTFNYLSFQPGVKFKDFTLGLGLGIPLGGSIDEHTGVATGTTDISASRMATMVELRLGGSVPILESELGDLRFIINGSYPLTKTFSSSLGFTFNGNPQSQDGPIPTLQAGLSFQFGVSK